MKIRYYLPVLAIIFLASCSDDDNGEGLTADNAKVQLDAIAGELNDDVVTMVQSKGVEGALSLADLLENTTAFGRMSPYQTEADRQLFAQQSSRLGYYFTEGIANLLGEESTDFAEWKGIYVWSPELGDFEKLQEESDIVEIRFPVEESTTNNGIFKLEKLEVVEIDMEELPTAIEAELTVDEEPFIDLSFVVNYDSNGNPELADIDLTVLPFALDISFNNTNANTTTLDATLLLESANLVGIDVTVTFDSEAKLEPVSVSGEVSYRNLRVVGSFNDTSMDNSVDGDPNDYFDLDLFIGEEKAGDIVFEFDETIDDYIAYVQYTDGSKENLEVILAEVIEELENLDI